MKKPGKHLKISLSGDLKSQLKHDPRNFSSSRSIDTKFLFKNDKLKELSKFAFNPSSRDVSHIRDHISAPLPKIVPSLPTNFSHLEQLYYSSDPLGNPFTVSSSNLISSLSCKKQACVEKVMTTHNSSLSVFQDDFPSQSIERLNFCNPSGRQDIKSLQSWLKEMKDQNLQLLEKDPLTWNSELIEKAEVVYVMAGKELVRQVAVHCFERGEVLKEVLWFFNTVFKAQKAQYMKDLKEKIEKVNKQIEEKIYKHARQIAQYEILVQKKTEKIDSLKDENEKLSQMLQKTQISLIKLQSAQEIKGGFLGIKQISPVLHISSNAKNYESKTEDLSVKTTEFKVDSPKTENFKKTEIFSETEKKVKSEEGPKFELVPNKDSIQIITVNEIINGEMQNNDKTCQAEEEKNPTTEQETQTEAKLKKPKQKFEMRSRILAESRLKFSLHLEFQNSFSILPGSMQAFNSIAFNQSLQSPSSFLSPSINLSLPKLDSLVLTKAQKTLKSYEDELFKLSESSKPMQKRTSLILNPSDLPLKSKSRLSPQNPDDSQRLRRSSQLVSPSGVSEDDLLLSNILSKQKAYNDLAESIKAKKTELSSLTSEIESKNQKLNNMKKEIQVKYLEIQATRSPLGLNRDGLKKILIDRLESFKEPSNEHCESPGINDLDSVVSSQFEVDSWKAGYNAGFEKGLAVGFRQGEELGIEVGEDRGYIKTINEIDEMTDSKSESSSGSEKEMINEELRPSLHDKASLRSRISMMSMSTSKSVTNEKLSEDPKLFKTFDVNQVKRSTTLKAEVKPKLTTKRSMDSFKPSRNSVDSAIIEEESVKRTSSVTENSIENSKLARNPKKNPTSRVERREKSEKTSKIESKKIENFRTPENPSSNPEDLEAASEVKTRLLKEKILKNEGLKDQPNEKSLKKQQTFLDSANKELITITINQEEKQLKAEKTEEPTESNKLIIRAKRSRKNSTSSKYSKSENDEDKVVSSAGEDLSEYEPGKKNTNQILRKRIREITKFNEFHFHTRSYQFVKKANPATKIIENFLKKNVDQIIKRSKMSKRMAFRLLSSIYNTFYYKSKDSILVEHLYDEFLLKYSVKSVCEKKLKEFLAALLKFSACRRSMTFLRLTGISNKLGIRGYSSYTIPVYIQALNFLINSKIGIVIAVDETAEVILIPVVRATECAKELLEGKLDKNQISKVVTRLESNSLKDPKKINTAGLIENELALEIISESFEDYQKGIVEGVEMIFSAVKFKEDASGITRGEFSMIVAFVSPGKWKDEDDETGFLSFDEVLARCLDKNLIGIEDVRNFVFREESLANERDFKEDLSLMLESLKKSDKKIIRGLSVDTWIEKINNLAQGFEIRDILESFIAWRLYFNELIL